MDRFNTDSSMPSNPRRMRALRLQVGHNSVTGIGMERRRFGDIFYLCMSMSWPRLLVSYGVFFILINILNIVTAMSVSATHLSDMNV